MDKRFVHRSRERFDVRNVILFGNARRIKRPHFINALPESVNALLHSHWR
jgi:hypothetical protein